MRRGLRSFRVRAAVPGVTVRLLLVAMVWAGAVVLVPFPLWQGVAVIAAVLAVVLPRSLAAWFAAACLVFGVLLTPPDPGRTALAVLLVHAIHVLASLSLVIPISSRVALAVLGPSLSRFCIIQLLAQPVVLAAWLLAPSNVEQGITVLAPLAAVMLVLGVGLALRAVRSSDVPRPARSAGEESVAERPRGANVRGPS
ncbi:MULTISPECIES: hypothetical protein [Microbacterium]|uniref:hypothetical protein n=1 Tax=Microbacterium TaxID=33882 RepID=UPI000492EFA9|nr:MULTISPECIES: hypothetical protein [unclassified Microbacterium]